MKTTLLGFFLLLLLTNQAMAAGVVAFGALEGGAFGSYGQLNTTLPPGLTNVTAVSAGDFHSLALRSDGTVVVWGWNAFGQTNMPAGLSNVVMISAGEFHSLALKQDGTVTGWGYNPYGECNVPAGLSNVVAVSAGGEFSTVLTSNGTVVAWGLNNYGQTNVPAGLTNVTAISANSDFVLALKRDGTVAVWGYNDGGQTNVPAGLSNVVAIATQYEHCLALKNDGTLVSWGQASIGSTSGISNVVQVADTWGSWALLLAMGGSVITQGINSPGELTIPPGTTNIVSLSSGGDFTLILTNDGSPWIIQVPDRTASVGDPVSLSVMLVGQPPLHYQWQINGANILGATNSTLNFNSVQLTNAGAYSLLVSNGISSVTASNILLTVINRPPGITNQPAGLTVLRHQSAAFSVGAIGSAPLSFQWQLNGTNLPNATSATLVLNNVISSNAGNYRVVVSNPWGSITSSNAALSLAATAIIAWGDNTYGQTNIPAGLTNVTAIADGFAHTLALKSDGTLAAWGYNADGETNLPAGLTGVTAIACAQYDGFSLGSGTVSAWGYDFSDETAIPGGLNNVIGIAAGYYHAVAVQNGGTVVQWGNGIGSPPVGLNNIATLAGGNQFNLGLKNDGTVTVWGYNYYDAGQTNVPPGLSNVVAVAAGYAHCVVVKSDGTVTAWGYNAHGETNVPAGLSGVVAVSSRSAHNLALKANGTVVAWGNNNVGQANVPAGLTNVIAVAAGDYFSTALVNDGTPVLFRQPASQTLFSGQNTILAGSAVGPALAWQWQFNGTNLAGATNASLPLVNVQPDFSGNYSLVVSNSFGVVVSTNAVLIVNVSPPVISGQPAGEYRVPHQTTSLAVTASGTAPLSYQWQFNGANLAGATNPLLQLGGATYAQAGGYRVLVTNSFGSITSAVATITVVPQMVVAWGDNSYGEASGLAVFTNSPVPMSAGEYHNLASVSGFVSAWGYNADGETNVPAGLNGVTQVSAGQVFSLALQSNGLVAAWGYGGNGETNVPAGLTNAVAIAAGGYHGLALKNDGSVAAWGYNVYGETAVPAGLSNVTALAGGIYHSVALKSDGTVAAWGAGSANAGTFPNFGQSTVPTNLTGVVAIAAGGNESLALKRNGTVVSWGLQDFYNVTPPADLTNVVALACGGDASPYESFYGGDNYNLALKADGSLEVWGFLHDTVSFIQSTIPSDLTNIVAISAGAFHCLALINDGSPVLLHPPQNLTVNGGGTAVLYAGAVGAPPLSFQWRLNGANLVGATNASLAISGAAAGSAGNYTVLVTSPYGSVTSSSAALTVIAPPVIGPLVQTNGVLGFGWTAALGVKYQIQYSTNLRSTNWLNLGAPVTASNLTMTAFDTATNALRFYRIVQLP